MSTQTRCLAVGLLISFGLVSGVEARSGADVIRESGVTGGLVVHLGCGDGRLTAELARNERFLVQGLDIDDRHIAHARQHVQSLGLYGRVSIERFRGPALPYAENLVNLLVVSDPLGVSEREMQRVLAPGGVLVTLQTSASQLYRKPWPKSMDEWTHFRYSAEGNMVSHDTLVGPPKQLQWACGPIFQRHHGTEPSITATVTSGGRIFYILDDSPVGFVGLPGEWRLLARDAFNGVLLWKRDMADWGSRAWSYWSESHAARFNHPLHVRKRLIAQGDRLYITLGFNSPITALNADTGETVLTYPGTQYADEFVLKDGVLFASVNDRLQKPWPGEGVRPEPSEELPPSQKTVKAIDAATGRTLWAAGPFLGNPSKQDRMASMRHLNLAVGENGVFLIDEKQMVGLNRETGKELWRVDRPILPQPPKKPLDVGLLYHLYRGENIDTIVYHEGRLFVMHPTTSASMKHNSVAILQALDAATGRELWRYDKATPIAYIEWPDVFAIGDTVWIPDRVSMELIGLDVATGKEKTVHSIEKVLRVGHHHRCYPNRASVNFAVLGRRGAEFVNWKTGEISLNHWLRTGCRSGHVLGNGLFYRPPDHCQCYMSFQPRGFLAMSAGSNESRPLKSSSKLIKGPAFSDALQISTSRDAHPESDWPAFRHDSMRSSMATCSIPTKLSMAWKADVPAGASAPTIAGGRVFVASRDTHQVAAFDATTGKPIWKFIAGGPVDSPPTVASGRVLFGSRDGSVYCVRARDGQLIWQFVAAPIDRRIVAFGQVESCWPVCGSVLVAGGKAYFVAGRTSLLDQGVFAYAVDVPTGHVLGTQHIYEIQTETKTTGELPQGALSDILTTDGVSVYLRNRKLDQLPAVTDVTPASLASIQPTVYADGGFANHRWFHRAFWSYQSSTARAKGNLIAFDDSRAYVAAANLPGGPNQTFHIPAAGLTSRLAGQDGDGPSWLANPNLQFGGTVLFATTKKSEKTAPSAVDPRGTKYGKSRQRPSPALWRQLHFPIYPWAMVVGKQQLAVAGPPASSPKDDPWADIEGRAGGVLQVLNANTGEVASELKLDSPPVWNGMAVANNHVYVTTQDGKLTCFETSLPKTQ